MREMQWYSEPARLLPVIDSVDVLVVGGGPAGVSAAISAAREGAKTMLVEQLGDVGGVATTGLMSHWTGNTRGGFYEEILERSRDDGGPENGDMLRQTINPEKLKTVFLEMLEEAGVRLRLYTMAAAPMMDGDTLCGVLLESKSGREAVCANVVIDASGDGDIAARAGVPFHTGREADGKMQPVSLMFKVAGVDTERAVFPGAFEESFQVEKGDLQTLGKEKLPFPAGHVLLYRTTLPGVVTCNMTNCIDVNGTDAAQLTNAVLICRRQIDAITAFLREYVPGFENCYCISSASSIGVRETRHFAGEATLTQEDILNARQFSDWVVRQAHFNFDVHNMTGNGLDETGLQKHFPQTCGYSIPYGCLVPQKVEGLLLAGRNISGTHLAHSSYRVMPICAKIGEAAGIAAALCASLGCRPRELPAEKIQERLEKRENEFDRASALQGE